LSTKSFSNILVVKFKNLCSTTPTPSPCFEVGCFEVGWLHNQILYPESEKHFIKPEKVLKIMFQINRNCCIMFLLWCMS